MEVDFISCLHIADSRYYAELQQKALSYDRMLFELITSHDYTTVEDGLVRVPTKLYPTDEQLMLSRSFGLFPQLMCLDYARDDRWVLADLPKEEVQRQLEGKDQGTGWLQRLKEVWDGAVIGYSRGGKFLPKFFLEKPRGTAAASGAQEHTSPAVLAIRALLWLTPCPELSILLLDWGRSYPPAGGLSPVLPHIIGSFLSGDFFTAKKLAYAQQLVSAQGGDGGVFGITSSSKVLVQSRNSQVLDSLERAQADGCKRVGVLYGGLHMRDMQQQLSERFAVRPRGSSWMEAWSMPINGGTGQGSRAAAAGSMNNWALAVAFTATFVALGAWDWSTAVVELGGLVQQLTLLVEHEHGHAADFFDSGPASEQALVSVLYLVRHPSLLFIPAHFEIPNLT
ncbi:unnamed protein product [Chrysoparadoxa australica]